MSGLGTRKSLAELVHVEGAEDGAGCEEDGEHAGPVGDLIAYCGNGGHALIGVRLPGFHQWQKEKTCLAHWRTLCELFLSNTDKVITCQECGTTAGLTLYVVWPGGFTTALSNHYYPFEVTRNRR